MPTRAEPGIPTRLEQAVPACPVRVGESVAGEEGRPGQRWGAQGAPRDAQRVLVAPAALTQAEVGTLATLGAPVCPARHRRSHREWRDACRDGQCPPCFPQSSPSAVLVCPARATVRKGRARRGVP